MFVNQIAGLRTRSIESSSISQVTLNHSSDKVILEMAVETVGAILLDVNNPLKDRFRALFTLRNLGGNDAVDIISRCFNDPSALLKHELAYCLGQMQNSHAIPILIQVLKDKSQEAMVRHEAGM